MWDSLAKQIEMEIVSLNEITQGEKLEEEQEWNTENKLRRQIYIAE